MTAISDNGLNAEVVKAACNKFNVANIGVLQDSPVLIPFVAQALGLS
jgi:hypothetical protein